MSRLCSQPVSSPPRKRGSRAIVCALAPGSCQSLPLAKAASRLWVPASAGKTRYLGFICAQYVLNHSQHNFSQRSTQEDSDEIEDWADRAARRMYEGAGQSSISSES